MHWLRHPHRTSARRPCLRKVPNYVDYLLPFQLLFRDIDLCEIPSYHKEFISNRLRDCAFTSFRDSSKINENNLSKKKHLALKDIIKNRDFVIQKADRSNTVVILNKNDYISKTKAICLNFRSYPLTKTKFWIILYIWKTVLLMFLKSLRTKR